MSIRNLAIVGFGLLLIAAADSKQSWFLDLTQSAGVQAPHHNRSFDNPYANIMEGYTALGASASVADFNGDGFEDLFVTDSELDGKNHLYRNNGNMTFTDVAGQAGVADGNDADDASADSLWFDYDNDGDPDLLVVRFGHNQLFENLGNGTFRDVTRQAGLYRYMNAITSVAFDYDRDGDLDLFVGGYFQDIDVFEPKTPRFFPESFETANNGGGLLVRLRNGSVLRKQRRRDLYRRHEDGRRHRHQEGNECRLGRLRQRRSSGHLRHEHHR
ncbi:MAG: VCBS repeat-containing protein [Acidobacteriota bacterium]